METEVISNIPVKQNFFKKENKPENFIMGTSSLPRKVLMKDGHGWKKFRPLGETQYKNGIDPATCTMGSTLNSIEHFGKLVNSARFQSDLSERFGAILQGQTGRGGWPFDAGMTVRRYGAIPEVFLPFDGKITTLAKYFSPRPMSYELFKIGQHWLSVYDFGLEWVVTPEMNLTTQEKNLRMKEALQYSILLAVGYAWSLHSDGKYYNDGPDIHAFNIDDYSDENYWDAFDTYPPYSKRLDWNYSPNYVIRYSLTRKIGAENVEFDPDTAPECRWKYIKYLVGNFISKFKIHVAD